MSRFGVIIAVLIGVFGTAWVFRSGRRLVLSCSGARKMGREGSWSQVPVTHRKRFSVKYFGRVGEVAVERLKSRSDSLLRMGGCVGVGGSAASGMMLMVGFFRAGWDGPFFKFQVW
jgi:hypothetical protein